MCHSCYSAVSGVGAAQARNKVSERTPPLLLREPRNRRSGESISSAGSKQQLAQQQATTQQQQRGNMRAGSMVTSQQGMTTTPQHDAQMNSSQKHVSLAVWPSQPRWALIGARRREHGAEGTAEAQHQRSHWVGYVSADAWVVGQRQRGKQSG